MVFHPATAARSGPKVDKHVHVAFEPFGWLEAMDCRGNCIPNPRKLVVSVQRDTGKKQELRITKYALFFVGLY